MASRILVVDDDAQIRKLLTYMLQSAGYEVIEAVDGFEALAQVATAQPDAVLLDLMMPNMDGFETCRRMRNIPTMSNVPIIILSAKDQVSDKVEGFKVGATDYLTKPVERAELLARLEAHIRVVEKIAPAQVVAKEVGRLLVVAGIKGGVGATTLAVNLAHGLRRETGEEVILVDDDLPYGDAALALNLVAQHGLSSLASYGNSVDREVVQRAMLTHSSGLRVLAAADTGLDPEPADPDIVLNVTPLLQQMADYVIVDAPPLVDYPLPDLVKACTRLLLVITSDIGTLRRTSVALNWLDSIDIDSEKLVLVLNRTGSGDIPVHQAQRHLGRPVQHLIEEDSHVRLAFNRGIPVIQDSPRCQASKSILQTIRSLKDLPKPTVLLPS